MLRSEIEHHIKDPDDRTVAGITGKITDQTKEVMKEILTFYVGFRCFVLPNSTFRKLGAKLQFYELNQS